MAYVDRPVADYVQTNLGQTALFGWTTGALEPLVWVLVVVLSLLFASGCWALSGRPLGDWTRTPLLCSWSVVWTLSATVVLKELFGRSSPDPAYVVRRVYQFHLLHGSPGYQAFPSGTTAVAAAIFSVVWIQVPRLRAACAILFTVLAIALVITNGHWVADLVAGGFLGASLGWMTVLLLG